MNRLLFILYIISVHFLWSNPKPFEFYFEPDDIFIIDKFQKITDSKKQREEKNRIYLTIDNIKENAYDLKGSFTIYTRILPEEKSFKKEEEYLSEFSILKDGTYIVDNKYKFPNFQSIPTFPENISELPPIWKKPGKEVIHLPEINLKIIVPFEVTYQYLGTEERLYKNQKILTHKIQYEYVLNHKVTPGNGPIQFIRGKTKGFIYFSTDLHIPVYDEQHLFYEFILKNNQIFREMFYIQSWYKKIKKINKKHLVNKFEEIPDKNFTIKETEKGVQLNLKNILFDFDSYTLKEESKRTLDAIYEILKEYPDREIQISGHTDNIGTEEYNLELSEKRARAVADYLLEKGLNEDQISYKGYGSSKPIVPNDTPENRAKNRRVEILILTE
ncbi:MAG: membrane protein [Leptospiraceae bacterium]|nr:MAG: membrane protein [Leptospiraceae bacterium]